MGSKISKNKYGGRQPKKFENPCSNHLQNDKSSSLSSSNNFSSVLSDIETDYSRSRDSSRWDRDVLNHVPPTNVT